MDTALGNEAAWVEADEVTAGLYIVVMEDEDPGDPGEPDQPYIPPEVPKTGDNSHPTLYLTLMAISGVVLVLLLWDRRQEKKR